MRLRHRMIGHERFDEDVAAYALDALDREERQAFEAHLASCVTCQLAVVELRRVSASIGLSSEPMEPPASLRARTLTYATGQPQAPPAARVLPIAPPAVPQSRSASPAWLLLAASLVGLMSIGMYAWVLNLELGAARETVTDMSNRVEAMRAQLVAARLDAARLVNTVNVLRSTDMVRIDLRGLGSAPAAIGRAYLSASRGLVFDAEHLPQTGASRTYQLWVIPPGANMAPVSAGTFDVDQAGTSTLAVALPSGVRLVAAVAVTEEPAGGSIKATTPPLLLGTRN